MHVISSYYTEEKRRLNHMNCVEPVQMLPQHSPCSYVVYIKERKNTDLSPKWSYHLAVNTENWQSSGNTVQKVVRDLSPPRYDFIHLPQGIWHGSESGIIYCKYANLQFYILKLTVLPEEQKHIYDIQLQ